MPTSMLEEVAPNPLAGTPPMTSASVRTARNLAADQLLHDLVVSTETETPLTIDDVVSRIKAMPRDDSKIRPAEPGLADALLDSEEAMLAFDEEAWNREWALAEAEINRLS